MAEGRKRGLDSGMPIRSRARGALGGRRRGEELKTPDRPNPESPTRAECIPGAERSPAPQRESSARAGELPPQHPTPKGPRAPESKPGATKPGRMHPGSRVQPRRADGTAELRARRRAPPRHRTPRSPEPRETPGSRVQPRRGEGKGELRTRRRAPHQRSGEAGSARAPSQRRGRQSILN